jgi:hypothetical protein
MTVDSAILVVLLAGASGVGTLWWALRAEGATGRSDPEPEAIVGDLVAADCWQLLTESDRDWVRCSLEAGGGVPVHEPPSARRQDG